MGPLDVDEGNDKRVTRSRQGIDTEKEAIKGRVRRRNALMVAAWKKYWTAIIPRGQHRKEIALRLWLDLLTQVRPVPVYLLFDISYR